MKLAVQQITIQADIEHVFDMLVDPALFVRWMADEALLDPTPGGVLRWKHPNGDTVSGRYVDIERPTRLVFTYGWERTDVGIPPGSTTVEINLTTHPDGSTLLELVHSGLEDRAADAHQGGWAHYLDRLRRSAEGQTPGPDPWAGRRVPTAAELSR
ncbi:Activator of Hsp90 ATPase 1 family protein [Mycolicibacterium rhodesiae JS60]|nr:Activator of Hsp90 ATPase 1 family protein [Mycolicibacterium rhodesiae JS60]